MTEQYTEWQQPFIELFSHYKGKVISDYPGEIKIVHRNEIKDHWGKKKKVDCQVLVGLTYIVDKNRYRVWSEEKTYEILGGSAIGELTVEEAVERAKKDLERYCFERNETEQMSLW